MNLFENLSLIEQNRERGRAAVLADARAKNRFAHFVRSASRDEFTAKLDLIADDLDAMILTACKEEGATSDFEAVKAAVLSSLGRIAAPEDGDSYWQETVDLPAAGPEGRSDEASGQKFDPNAHGDYRGYTTPSLEVPSNEHPAEMQDIEDGPDLWSQFDPKDLGLIDRQKVDTPSEEQVGEGTSVYPAGNQAQPVTSKTAAPATLADLFQNLPPEQLEQFKAELDAAMAQQLPMVAPETSNDSHLDNSEHLQAGPTVEAPQDSPATGEAEGELSHDNVQRTHESEAGPHVTSNWRVV